MWVDPNSWGSLHHPDNDAAWASLVDICGGGPKFRHVLDVARRNGSQSGERAEKTCARE